MGVHARSFPEQAPADDDVAHARLPVIRRERRCASFSKRVFSQRRGGPAFRFPVADQLPVVGERVHRGGVRDSSVAGRIGRLDRGTQRRLERRFLYGHTDRVRRLYAEAFDRPLRDVVDLVRVRVDVETDASHDADRFAAARLLAAGKV